MKAPAVIARKFQIERLLGQGGMGHVYLARDPRLGNRRVAIKLLRVDSDEARHRFEQEAASAANLHHRNIVVIYEYGDHEGQPYIAMEFIEGDPLSTIIGQRRPLSLGRKLDVLDDLCAGLGFAHQQGIVHRDVKPGNLLLDRDGCLKIVDFGIARAHAGSRFTVGTIGTPNYMSPEQVNGDVVDQRSDIFAVGLLAYELLSYRMAFPGESGRVYDSIRYREPEPLAAIVPDCDPRLVSLVQRAIAKRPQDRYQRLNDLRADLEVVRRTAGSAPHKPLSDRIETVVQKRPPTPLPNPLDRAALARRRQRIVDEHLEAGTRALEAEDLEAAVDRFEQAAALDELNPQAIEMLALARERLTDRHVQELLKQAEVRLSGRELPEASDLLEQALALRPDNERGAALRQRMANARAVQSALEVARGHLANGVPEAALRAASEALAYEPSNADALDLTKRAFEAIDELHRQARQRQRAQQTVAHARELAGRGRLVAALAVLQSFTPADDLVDAALAELQPRLDAARRQIAEAGDQLERALAVGDLATAEAIANHASQIPADDDAAAAMRRRVDAAIADRLARATSEARARCEMGDEAGGLQMLHAFKPFTSEVQDAIAVIERENKERSENVANTMADARRLSEAGRIDEALMCVDRALAGKLGAAHVAALEALRSEIRNVQAVTASAAEIATPTADQTLVVERSAASVRTNATPVDVQHGDPNAAQVRTGAPAHPRSRTPRPARRLAAAAGALVVAVVVTAVYVFTGSRAVPPGGRGEPISKGGVPAPAADTTGGHEAVVDGAGRSTDVAVPVVSTLSNDGVKVDPKRDSSIVSATGSKPELKPDSKVESKPDPRIAEAQAAANERVFTVAIDLYQRILSVTPNNQAVAAALRNARQARARQQQVVGELLAKGDARLKERAYAQAIEAFEAVRTEEPANDEALARITLAKAMQSRADAAAADILGPAKPVSDPAADSRAKLLKQANALLDAGLLDDAITTFETVLKTRPNDADAIAGREKALAMKNRAKF